MGCSDSKEEVIAPVPQQQAVVPQQVMMVQQPVMMVQQPVMMVDPMAQQQQMMMQQQQMQMQMQMQQQQQMQMQQQPQQPQPPQVVAATSGEYSPYKQSYFHSSKVVAAGEGYENMGHKQPDVVDDTSGRYEDEIPAKEFGQDEDDIEGLEMRKELDQWQGMGDCSYGENVTNTIIWYYKQMAEFQDSPPEDKNGGKWQRIHIDEEPCKHSDGHSKEGVAHGIAIYISPRRIGQYMGTFVNGLMHGYGVLHIGHFNSNYYEGEFQNGEPHGYGKFVVVNGDESMSHEGWWEYGSFQPKKRLTEEGRKYDLKMWEGRQDQLLQETEVVKQALQDKLASEEAAAIAHDEAWQIKREAERPTEMAVQRKHRVDRFTEFAANWDGILNSGMYPRKGLEEEGEEAMTWEMNNALQSFVRHEMTYETGNLYEDDKKDKNGKHGMWVPKIEPEQEFNMGPDNEHGGGEEDEEGMD